MTGFFGVGHRGRNRATMLMTQHQQQGRTEVDDCIFDTADSGRIHYLTGGEIVHFALPPIALCLSDEGQIGLQKAGISSP